MQRFPSDSESEYLVARAIAVGNYLAVVALFQTLIPLPKESCKNKLNNLIFVVRASCPREQDARTTYFYLMPKCCFKNANVRSRANSAASLR